MVEKKLIWVKTISFLLLLIAAAFIGFGRHYVLGVIFMCAGFFVEWKFYRCPHCNKSLDARMKIDETTHCPNCGKIIYLKW